MANQVQMFSMLQCTTDSGLQPVWGSGPLSRRGYGLTASFSFLDRVKQGEPQFGLSITYSISERATSHGPAEQFPSGPLRRQTTLPGSLSNRGIPLNHRKGYWAVLRVEAEPAYGHQTPHDRCA